MIGYFRSQYQFLTFIIPDFLYSINIPFSPEGKIRPITVQEAINEAIFPKISSISKKRNGTHLKAKKRLWLRCVNFALFSYIFCRTVQRDDDLTRFRAQTLERTVPPVGWLFVNFEFSKEKQRPALECCKENGGLALKRKILEIFSAINNNKLFINTCLRFQHALDGPFLIFIYQHPVHGIQTIIMLYTSSENRIQYEGFTTS